LVIVLGAPIVLTTLFRAAMRSSCAEVNQRERCHSTGGGREKVGKGKNEDEKGRKREGVRHAKQKE
jgi:hypothetical protein